MTDETRAGLRELWMKDEKWGKKSLEDFLSENEEEMSRLVSVDDGALLSLIKLRGKISRSEIKMCFPRFTRRKEENLITRGLLREEEKDFFSTSAISSLSLYPLLGEKNDVVAPRTRPDDLVKCLIAMAAHNSLRERDWRLGKCFQSDEFARSFPSFAPSEISRAASIIAESLTSLGVVKKDGKNVRISTTCALSFLSLSPESYWSYILWPEMDESKRQDSFRFLSLLFNSASVRRDEFPSLLERIGIASGWWEKDADKLLSLLLVEEKEGYITPLAEEARTEGAIISSDYTITFTGATPPLLALISHLKTSDRMKIWLISKSSMKSAFTLGYRTEDIVRYLEGLSDLTVSDMLSRRIESWEKEYRSLIFERALVLRTDETRDRIIRNIPQLAPYIIESPKEGIFLMDYETESEWRDILYTFGFDMLAPTKGPEFQPSVPPREFEDSEEFELLPQKRAVPYSQERKKALLDAIKAQDRSERKIKRMMVDSGIIFTEELAKEPLKLEMSDAWNYMEKVKLLEKAQKDKSWCVLAEDHKGASSVGSVESVSAFEDGDQLILGRQILSISKIYRVFLIPVSFCQA